MTGELASKYLLVAVKDSYFGLSYFGLVTDNSLHFLLSILETACITAGKLHPPYRHPLHKIDVDKFKPSATSEDPWAETLIQSCLNTNC